jgi:hypothetical protein
MRRIHVLIMRLTPVLSLVFLVAACQSGPTFVPTAPAAVPQGTGTSPGVRPGTPGPEPIPGTRIAAGSPVAGTIDERDPTCFRNWDQTGHCRQYDLTAPSDGMMRATLKWPGRALGAYNPDVFLVAPDGTWVYAEDTPDEKHAMLPVKRGLIYRIVVLSYGASAQAFELIVDVEP